MPNPAKSGPLADPVGFSESLVAWFREEGRDYPWRRTTDPYAILVSEMMLQQTRIATVVEGRFFETWMARFPDVQTLAEASEPDVLRHWAGLGYYRRARYLQKAAMEVVKTFNGIFPTNREELLKLPGIGAYTAAAVASFAFNQSEPLVDGNVARVLARLFNYPGEVNTPAGMKVMQEWATALIPPHGTREHNAALMELGQTHCRVGTPTCLLCPVRSFCTAKNPSALPLRQAGPEMISLEENAMFLRNANQVCLQKEQGSRRTGFWKLPTLTNLLPNETPTLEFRYTITKHRVTLRIYQRQQSTTPLPEACEWISLEQLPSLPLGAPYQKALAKLLV